MIDVCLVFGHPKNLAIQKLEVLESIQKGLKAKVSQKSKFAYYFNHTGKKFGIRFCYNPRKDSSWLESKEFIKKNFKDEVPETANELAGKIKAKTILFFGTCGALKKNCRIGEILFPTSARKAYFKGNFITKEQLSKQKPSAEIRINNFLAKKLKGKKAKVITTNITAFSSNLKGVSQKQYSKKMSKFADVVEKELFEIAKKIEKNQKFGAMLVCSDTFEVKFQSKYGLKIKKQYAKAVLSAIKAVSFLPVQLQ